MATGDDVIPIRYLYNNNIIMYYYDGIRKANR